LKTYKEKEMVDFRRMIPVLAVIAFLLGSSGTASAQNTPFQCFLTGGVSTPARSEDLTALVGDLVLNCTGGIPTAFGQPIPQVNIQVFLNTSLTSRLLTTSSTGIQWSEALLILDEAAPGKQFPCNSINGVNGVCPGFGNGFGTGNSPPATIAYYGNGTPGQTQAAVAPYTIGCTAGTVGGCPGNNKNVFQGQQTASNSVTFIGVPIDPPGTNGSRVVRITNVRGNANALGVAGANATPTPIVETISPTPASFLPVSNPSQTVAFIQRGLIFGAFASNAALNSTTALSFNLQQCDNSRNAAGQGTTLRIGVLRYTEQFATAFRKRIFTSATGNYITAPTLASQQNNLTSQTSNFTIGTYNTESGFVSNLGDMATLASGAQTGTPGTTAGFADWGTRVKAV